MQVLVRAFVFIPLSTHGNFTRAIIGNKLSTCNKVSSSSNLSVEFSDLLTAHVAASSPFSKSSYLAFPGPSSSKNLVPLVPSLFSEDFDPPLAMLTQLSYLTALVFRFLQTHVGSSQIYLNNVISVTTTASPLGALYSGPTSLEVLAVVGFIRA
ncbi:hypothetical protein BDP27DRAFT_1450332 [Rhodocollybia butyracea]|uniref:Uncharacterized protein n=1 Tax=Rhodocollybia butyracea TaxID=206335 RepID=A0A9P5PNF1_9AGAR|nr:hypothetical protein BDP27DRAFT_1450332 [Rhodocollybia butyracea]